MKTKELPILSAILYILAVIFAFGAAVIFYGAYSAVAPAIEQGLDLATEWPNLVTFFMTQSLVYFAYPILFVVGGRLLQYAATRARNASDDEDEDSLSEQLSISDIISQNNVAEDVDDNEDE